MVIASLTGFLQYVVDGFINGSAYGLIGISFGLIVAVTGRFHFAWAIAYALAGYFTAWMANEHGLAPLPAALVGLAVSVAFAIALELLVYRPIDRRSGANSLLAVFVASFGITIAGASVVRLLISVSGSESFTWIPIDRMHIGQITFTSLDVWTVVILWALAAITWALLRFSPLGRRIRAVQVNPEMAQAVGIATESTYLIVFVLATVLGGIAAILFAMKYAASPEMGMTPVFYAFVVAFAAGLGRSPLRVMTVGTALGVIEGMSAQVLSTQWQQVVIFAVLLVFLVLKAAYAWRPSLFRVARATSH